MIHLTIAVSSNWHLWIAYFKAWQSVLTVNLVYKTKSLNLVIPRHNSLNSFFKLDQFNWVLAQSLEAY